MNKFFLVVLAILSILVFWVYFKKDPEIQLNQSPISNIKTIKIGDTFLDAEVADTDAKRVKGLSGRESLPVGTGLLFIFEAEGYRSIWMKDMNFPIDIAWLNKDKKIIHIEHSVSPDTYPKIFTAPSPALFVLETNAGFFAENRTKIGDLTTF